MSDPPFRTDPSSIDRDALVQQLAAARREIADLRLGLVTETERLRAAVLVADEARRSESAALAETRAMLRTLDHMLAAPDDMAACAALVNEVAHALQGTVVMLLAEQGDRRQRVIACSDPAQSGTLVSLPDDWLARDRRMVDIRRSGVRLSVGAAEAAGLIVAPVLVQESPDMAVAVFSPVVGRFSGEEQQLLQRTARMAAQAFETIRQTRRSHSLAALIAGAPDAGEGPGLIDPSFAAVNSALGRVTRAQAAQLEALGVLLQSDLDDVDASVSLVLEQLGRLTGCDRTYVFRRIDEDHISNTHEWCAEGIEPAIQLLERVPLESFMHWLGTLESGGTVQITDVDALPEDDTVKELLQLQGIRSLLLVPMVQQGRLTGIAGYDAVKGTVRFLPGEVMALRTVANAIDNVLNVREARDRLNAVHDALRQERDRHRRVADLSRAIEQATGVGSWELLLTDGSMMWSPVMLAIHGLPLTWKPDAGTAFRFFLPEAEARFRKAFDLLRGTGTEFDLELPFRGATGRQGWMRLTGAAQLIEGTPVLLYGTCKDITREREANRELVTRSEIARRTTNLVVVTGPDRRIEWVNPAFEARTGWHLDEVRGAKPGDLLQFDGSDPAVIAHIRTELDALRPVRAEIRNRDRKGNVYWIDMDIQPLTAADGTLTGFVAVQSDITVLRAQAEALAEAAAQAERMRQTLSDAVEALEDGFAQYDADGRLVVCNRSFREIIPEVSHLIRPGLQFEDLLRAGIAAGAFPDAADDPDAYVANVLRLRAGPTYWREIPLEGGRWLRLVDRALPDGGRVEAVVDITDLKQAEAKAQTERAEAMDSSRDGIALNDPEGRFLYMNPAHLRMFGYNSVDEVKGMHWSALYEPEVAARIEQEAIPQLLSEGSWRGEVAGRTRFGTPVEQEVSLTLRPDGGLLCITRDISDRRRAEAERLRLSQELEQAQRRELIGQVAAGLAHDFNNLLATISGSAALTAMALPEDHDARPHAERILAATEQANGLVRRLLGLGTRKSVAARIDLRNPVRDAAELARAGLGSAVSLSLELPSGPCMADADPTEIVQIVLNLAINARDAMQRQGGRVTVALMPGRTPTGTLCVGHPVTTPQDHWVIRVADNGPGMTADVLAQVFRPYFSTKGGGGSGLGLASVKSLVAQAGGAIHVDTAPGEGAAFEIFWPQTAAVSPGPIRAVEAVEPEGPAQAAVLPGKPLTGKRILLVDDAEQLVEVLTGMLEAAGAQVAATTDPLDALEVFADDPAGWDAVVTDFDMPGLNGAEVARAVAKQAPGLPILLVTALPDWQARGKGAHFAAVLGKPVTGRQLVSTLVGLLDRTDG